MESTNTILTKQPPTILDLLKQTTLESLSTGRGLTRIKPVITVTTNTTLEKALSLLTNHKLHSLPVRDTSKNVWPGFITINQILVYVLSLTYDQIKHPQEKLAQQEQQQQPQDQPQEVAREQNHGSTVGSRSSSLELWLKETYDLQQTSKIFSQKKVGEIINKSEEILAISDKISLLDVLHILSGAHSPTKKIHRCVSFNKIGEIQSVISQSYLLDYFASKISSIPLSFLTQTLSEVGLVQKDKYFLSVHQNLPAIDSFWKLYTEGLDTLAVLNDEGFIVSSLSVSDLSSLSVLDLNSLKLSTLDYILRYGRRRTEILSLCRDRYYDTDGEDLNHEHQHHHHHHHHHHDCGDENKKEGEQNKEGREVHHHDHDHDHNHNHDHDHDHGHSHDHDHHEGEFLYKHSLLPPICVLSSSTIENILLKMSVHKIHRIWVVEERKEEKEEKKEEEKEEQKEEKEEKKEEEEEKGHKHHHHKHHHHHHKHHHHHRHHHKKHFKIHSRYVPIGIISLTNILALFDSQFTPK